ncbi:histo-blood group ABO system transferase-like isoform X1 [Chelonoidis abingdonii]|uniref:histo-blood group ABO system transferase-like isoform X1 n=2 Tax=Chelonoidis abingdonii TaxID=106734 RepID=UPI003F490BE9
MAVTNNLRNSFFLTLIPVGAIGCAMDKNQGKTGGIKGYFTKHHVYVMGCLTLLCFSCGYFWNTYKFTYLDTPIKICNTMSNHILEDLLQIELPRMIYTKPQILKPSRSDVLMMTPWFAPIVWEGTYNFEILNEQFRQRNVTVGLTVFAIKKYVVFLKTFLETAEMYFMVGHRVNYYIFTDRPEEVPQVALKEGRNVVVLQVPNSPRWQEISMRRMEVLSYFSQQRFINEVSYLVCVDVDMKFNDQVGVEILSDLFGTLHPGFYTAERQSFTYERRPASQAYVPSDEGDFYYMGSIFGGTVMEVYKLTKKCHEAIMVDKANGIEAIWQEESHLNKYFLYHKPSKILSPEYMWDDNLGRPEILKKRRFLAVRKNHAAIRNK